MKVLAAIIAFVVGLIVATVVCSVLNVARDAQRQVQLLSDVHHPIRQCLDDIVQTHDRGDVSLAEQKLRLLQQRWFEYLNAGGRSPELFANEVMELAPATTRPAH